MFRDAEHENSSMLRGGRPMNLPLVEALGDGSQHGGHVTDPLHNVIEGVGGVQL